MAEILLDITLGTGLFVAFMHVVNRRFIAPVYDIVANLTGFVCATWASILLGHRVAAVLAACAVACWLSLTWRTASALRAGHEATGQAPPRRRHERAVVDTNPRSCAAPAPALHRHGAAPGAIGALSVG